MPPILDIIRQCRLSNVSRISVSSLVEGLLGAGYVFPGVSKQYYHAGSTQRGLLKFMVHHANAIDCAGADGTAEGAGSAQSCLSADKEVLERLSRKRPFRALLRDRVRATRKRFATT